MDNRIRQLRTGKGFSQRQLADLVGTSQQQIQRIESGAQAARFDIAARICAALDASMETVFPAAKAPLRKAARGGGDITAVLQRLDDQLEEEMLEAGIDTDSRVWTIKYLLRSGAEGMLRCSGAEERRLFRDVQAGGAITRFVVIDTETDRVAINLRHLIFCQFLFDPPSMQDSAPQSDASSVVVHTSVKPEPLVFSVDPDVPSLGDEGEDELDTQLEHMLYMLESSCEDDEVVSFLDVDGERVFLRAADTAMVSVSLSAVEPSRADEDE